MKRIIAFLLLAVCVLSLSACGAKDAVENETAPVVEAEIVAEEPTPAPTPEPTPVPVVELDKYEYEKFINQSLALGFRYPSHWVQQAGRQTIAFSEPVNEGEMGARMAVSVKAVKKAPDTSGMKTHFNSFLQVLSDTYEDFEYESASSNIKFMKKKAYNTTYTATVDGVRVKGFVIITYVSKAKNLYVFHFSVPEARYDEMKSLLQQLESNVVALI